MRSTNKKIALFTAAVAALTFTSMGTINAAEAEEPVVSENTEVKTSATANKNFHNRRGFYDRVKDEWVYFGK